MRMRTERDLLEPFGEKLETVQLDISLTQEQQFL